MIFYQFFSFKLKNVEEKCLNKMQTVLYQYLMGSLNYLTLTDSIFKMRLHNAYKWPFWEHIIDHISKTGNVSSLKFSGKQDLTTLICITLIKCSFMTQFFCSIDIT